MSLDLGDLGAFATAIGLVDGAGEPVAGWFADPGDHLTRVLANPVQRVALIELVDELLGGSAGTTDEEGRSWLPIVEVDGDAFRLFVTVEEAAGGATIRLGAGAQVRVSSDGIRCEVDAHVPLFAASGTAPVTDPVLVGKPGAPVEITLRLGLPPGTAPGRVELAGAELTAHVPTAPGEPATVRLALLGLRLPGAAQPRDLIVDAADVSELDDALLELVLGLVAAQVDGLPAGSPLRGLAAILGLVDDGVPDFPVAELAGRGPTALLDWLAESLTGAAKADWLDGLATLLGGAVTDPGTAQAAVEVLIAGATVRIDLLVTPGMAGRPVVVPRVSAGVTGGQGARLALSADVVSLDLGSGSALALPRLSLTGRLDPPGATKLLPAVTGPGGLQVEVGALEVGVALDAARRPVLVVQAEDADIGATHYDVLDLSTPDALAAAAAQAVNAAAAAVLAGIGAAGDAVSVLLGLTAPATAAGVPLVNAGDLLRDPVGAVRARWEALLARPPADVRAVLEAAQDAIADDRVRGASVTGEGTAAVPWLVPLAPGIDLRLVAAGNTLTVGVTGAARLDDLAGTGVEVGLDLAVDVVAADLAAGTAEFLPHVTARLALEGPGGAALQLGAMGIVASAAAIGAAVDWAPSAGVRIRPILNGAQVHLLDGAVSLPDLALDSDGRLDLTADGWQALERIAGALAAEFSERTGQAWPTELAALLGWSPEAGPVGSTPITGGVARLAMAELVVNPTAALRAFVEDLVQDEAALRTLLNLLADVLAGGTTGGRAATSRPWAVPLLAAIGASAGRAAEDLPGLTVSLGASGVPSSSLVPPALRRWLPGDDGLGLGALLAALSADAEVDDVVADLLAGRTVLGAGLTDLVDRWVATDGLVTLPEDGLPAGVSAHRPSELAHGAPLGGPAFSEVLAELFAEDPAGPPATVIMVAVSGAERHGAPDVLAGPVLDGLPAAQVLDLTAAGLPPEAFVAPDAAGAVQPVWSIRLGTRAACRLADADPDGIAGQAARLRRMLQPLAGPGRDVVVVAHGGAGHAALRAVEGMAGVRAVVTVGTPWSPVSIDSLDAVGAGEALRLLAALLRLADAAAADPADDATDPDEPDDPDLALARAVVAALLDRDPYPDPLADLRPPGGLTAPAGIPVHAVVGSMSEPALRRALTATVAAGLAARARSRERAAAAAVPEALRLGFRLPIDVPAGPGGITASIRVGFELIGIDPGAEGGGPVPVTGPALAVGLDLGAADGWLVGGPDPGRASGGARPLACRRLTTEVRVPVRSWSTVPAPAEARAHIVLHEVHAFGIVRDRWVVDPADTTGSAATPLLPEARAVLGEIVARLGRAAATDPAVDALRAALTALGILGPDGGIDAVTIERLLLDPEPTVVAMVGEPARRRTLVDALRRLARDSSTAPDGVVTLRFGPADEVVATLDVEQRSAGVSASGSGPVPWSLGVTSGPAGITAAARFGPDVAADDGPSGLALTVDASASGPSVRLLRRPAGGGVTSTALWPDPSADAALDALTATVPGVALGALVDAARSTLASNAPAAADLIDGVLDALGVLGPPTGASAQRPLLALADLLADPGSWLSSRASGLATAVPALVDAARGLLGAPGAAGSIELADGIALRAAGVAGQLVVGVDVDAGAFTAPVGGLGLVLLGTAGLAVAVGPSGTVARPDLQLEVGVGGVGALRLRVGPDGGGAGDAVGATVLLAPQGRPEIVLLPGGPGLGGLADAALAGAVAALPELLDTLAANDPAAGTAPAALDELAGRLVARLGDALALRTGDPARFNAAALTAFGTDPATALAARGAALAATGLATLSEAIGPLLGPVATRSVGVDDGALVVDVGELTLRWRPGTARVEAGLELTGVPGVERLDVDLAVDPTGLASFDVAVGPAAFDTGVGTLAPFARVRVGAAPADGRVVEVGLGLGVGTPAESRLVARWELATGELGLVAARLAAGSTEFTESTDPGAVTLAVVGAVLDLAGGIVLAVPDVQTALGEAVLGTTVGGVLDGVLLAAGSTDRFDPALAAELADPGQLLRRLAVLAGNLANAPDAAIPIDGRLTLRMTTRPDGTTTVVGLNLAVDGSWELNPGGDVVVSLENEAGWITPPAGVVPAGLTVELLALPAAGPPEPRPSLAVGGLGLRLSRPEGPLLDAGVSIASVAVHLFGAIAPAGSSVSLAGGVRLELAGLGVPLAGASGGDNAVAKGIMAQSGTGEDAPTPRFSPALAVQKHVGGPLLIALTAGEGSGPWWLTIQREFGPIYLEQVGLAVVNRPAGIESIGVLIDGKVSLLGLSASVDDLSLTYVVAGGGSALDPSRYRVDLAGFAVAADVGGVSLSGGLRRFSPATGGVEYLGMLMARLSVYGLTVYGGYGVVGPAGDQYTSIFLFGAVNGPIGGPPAFFVTGIGGGFGINRRLVLPTDLSTFDEFPLIKALDPAARSGDPFTELERARGYFPAERDTFWFAAGLSFTSFALVDGVAVVAMQIGGGFELSLLGLARMALPRPEAALVSIEMALVARFSTREGVILVQAQLTDNSWLLAPEVRLTGGFAFASFLAGPNRGQFVVTMGGYHPDFHRDGYPVVPRLGLRWQVGDAITVVGESYFALTSEALMAGTRVEVSARLGPGWAHAVFGADGIVFFDPFWLKVTVYASIDAGVTVDLWFAEVTISVHLSARVEITGPPYRAVARFEVGPVDLTLAIGPSNSEPRYLNWDAFVRKYLEESPNRINGQLAARVLATVTGSGAVPPSGSSSDGGDRSPDGTTDRPFRVLAEFELTVTSTVPLRGLVAGAPRRNLAASRVVSVAPMGLPTPADVLLTLTMVGPPSASIERIDRLTATPQQLGAFPVGTWGLAQDLSNPTVPAGDVISGTDRVVLRAEAEIPTRPDGSLPPAIPYRQVETGARRINPLITEDPNRRQAVRRAVRKLADTVPPAADADARLAVAATLLAERGGRSPADVAGWQADRAAAPILGSLGEGLGFATRVVTATEVTPPAAPAPAPPRPPLVRALLTAPEWQAGFAAVPGQPAAGRLGTTVSAKLLAGTGAVRLPAPSMSSLDAGLLAAVPARLLRVPAAAASGPDGTVVAAIAPPVTATPSAGAGVTAGRTSDAAETARLAGFADALAGRRTNGRPRTRRAGSAPAAVVATGEVAVLELPDAARDTDAEHRPTLVTSGGRARVIALGPGGGVLADQVSAGDEVAFTVPAATRGLVVVGLHPDVRITSGQARAARPDVVGWLAGVPLPAATDGVLIAAGAVVDAVGRVGGRGVAPVRSGWVLPDELVGGESAVVTTFAAAPATVGIVLEGGAGDDVALGVDGAQRPTGPDGAPDPPIVVVDGPRSVLIFRLRAAVPGTAVTVTSGAARRLAGVIGVPVRPAEFTTKAPDAAELLARAVARLGLAELVPPPTEPGPGAVVLTWKEG